MVVTGGVGSIGGGIGAVGGTAEELEREIVDDGACRCCLWPVDCGIKSEREGRIEGLKKTLANASTITFLSLSRSSIVQSH